MDIIPKIEPLSFYWETDPEKVDLSSFESIEDDRTGFFLKTSSEVCNNLGVSRTQFLVKAETNELIGFIALSAVRLEFKRKYGPRGDETAGEDEKDYFPIIKIDQIAVSKPFIRKGVGSYIMKWLIDLIFNELTPIIGFRFIFCEILKNKSNNRFFKDKFRFKEICKKWVSKSYAKKLKIRDDRPFGPNRRKLKTIKMIFKLYNGPQYT